MRYELGQETVWVKCANTSNPSSHYRLLKALAVIMRAPVLQPVPNPGGAQTIATEVRRLRNFAAKGLRAPTVLAATEQAFLMRHLGQRDQEAPTLSQSIERAMEHGPQATLQQWQRGLEGLALVHAQGECLSQAAARNMVCCPDGVIGFIDFEDDPAGTLPLPVCHARDALNYAQSTALFFAASPCTGAGQAAMASLCGPALGPGTASAARQHCPHDLGPLSAQEPQARP